MIVLIEQNRSAGGRTEFHGSAHVVDVSVGDYDLLDLQVVLADESQNVLYIVTRIDDHSFAGSFVADDRAVALQRADGKNFVDHGDIVASGSATCSRRE